MRARRGRKAVVGPGEGGARREIVPRPPSIPNGCGGGLGAAGGGCGQCLRAAAHGGAPRPGAVSLRPAAGGAAPPGAVRAAPAAEGLRGPGGAAAPPSPPPPSPAGRSRPRGGSSAGSGRSGLPQGLPAAPRAGGAALLPRAAGASRLRGTGERGRARRALGSAACPPRAASPAAGLVRDGETLAQRYLAAGGWIALSCHFSLAPSL